MYGIIRPCYAQMTPQERREYKSYYCGLCMGLGAVSGPASRMLTSYDLTLAYLVADSVLPGHASDGKEAEDNCLTCPKVATCRKAYRNLPGNEAASLHVETAAFPSQADRNAGKEKEGHVAERQNTRDGAVREYRSRRCPFNPFKKIRYRENAVLMERLATLNDLLAYYKVKDDIEDDGSWTAKMAERLMRTPIKRLPAQEGQVQTIVDDLSRLREQEKAHKKLSLDEAAEPFAHMLEVLMAGCVEEPAQAKIFRKIGFFLGQWVYVCDACLDLYEDEKKGNYNPILAGWCGCAEEILRQRRDEILIFLMDCRRNMLQLITLLHPARNRTLIWKLFYYSLPVKVSEMLLPDVQNE